MKLRHIVPLLIAIVWSTFFSSPLKADPDGSALSCSIEERYPDFPNPDLLNRVARGFNLPNWDAKNPQEWPKEETLIALRKRGLSHIRLPVFHDAFMGNDLQSPEAQSYMAQISSYTSSLIDMGYVVSIDLHPSSAFNSAYQTAPDATLGQLIKIWKALSVHIGIFKPQDVLAEVLNEPDTDALTWQKHSTILAKEIRGFLPNHTIILSPSGPQRHEALLPIIPVDDPNVLYAVHFYDPFIFTHQGATWLSSENPISHFKQLAFPIRFDDQSTQKLYNELISTGQNAAALKLREELYKPWDFTDIDSAFNGLREWSKKHKRLVIINEFGALSYHTPRISRLLWLKTIVERSEKHCMAWTHWDYSDGFGFVDSQTQKPDQAILQIFLNGKQ